MSKSKKITSRQEMGLSADALALWSALLALIGDLLAILSLLKARLEKQTSS